MSTNQLDSFGRFLAIWVVLPPIYTLLTHPPIQALPTTFALPAPDQSSNSNSPSSISGDYFNNSTLLESRLLHVNGRDIVRTDCDPNADTGEAKWGYADLKRIWQGIHYLEDISSKRPQPKLGAEQCGRVSCSWKAAIYWCNDVCLSSPSSPLTLLSIRPSRD